MKHFFVFFVFSFFVLTAANFKSLPGGDRRKLTAACVDFCNGQSRSTSTGFNFKSNGWELCNCPIAQGSHQWANSGCWQECVDRCVSTKGKCADPKKSNKKNQGPCCSTADNNSTIEEQCYSTATGLCYCNGQNAQCGGGVTVIGGFGRK
ncbi:unnamed protein product, partial [Mesorhabditis belari]|uniref:Uncharacterized protein n=1 Tax=Mesorhabditis belari TaxID=2138241 RepID=A0AAF3EDI4_9BILA